MYVWIKISITVLVFVIICAILYKKCYKTKSKKKVLFKKFSDLYFYSEDEDDHIEKMNFNIKILT